MQESEAWSYSGRDNLESMRQARRYNQYLIDIVTRNTRGPIILDFGAGSGTFAIPIAKAKGAGSEVICVEPDPALQASLRGASLQVHCGLETIAPDSLDSVYSLNVLEHIEDDYALIEELGKRIRHDGTLLVYVPAFNLLFSAMDRLVGHFRRYRKEPLETMLRSAGFEIETSRYVDSLGFLVALLYKVIGNSSGRLSPRSVQVYDTVVFPLSKWADRFLGHFMGKNLLVVARRTGR